MKTIVLEKEIEVDYASANSVGYGHKKITVELYYEGEYNKFSSVTNNMPGYDAATELDGEEKYFALYQMIEPAIENEIEEWISSIDADIAFNNIELDGYEPEGFQP